MKPVIVQPLASTSFVFDAYDSLRQSHRSAARKEAVYDQEKSLAFVSAVCKVNRAIQSTPRTAKYTTVRLVGMSNGTVSADELARKAQIDAVNRDYVLQPRLGIAVTPHIQSSV